MSDAERVTATEKGEGAARVRYGTIVVVGGGCYGSYYVRQLARASQAGALCWDRLLVVDRDPDCRVADEIRAGADGETGASAMRAGVTVVVDEWRHFFSAYFDEAATDRGASERDSVVPSPLMPHLMYEWLLVRAKNRWPGRTIETAPLLDIPAVPWERAAPDGTHYVSFAEWTCPINCVEPATCPHTRSERTWSLPPTVRSYVAHQRSLGRPLAGPVVFHCTHRAYGVGMFDTSDVLDADELVRSVGEAGEAEVLVGTVSHCHGALNRLVISA